MNTELMFSSATAEWETPQEFFDRYNATYHFGIDVCATEQNAKCYMFFDKEINGLAQDWSGYGPVWCNPPYGKEIRAWVQKAYEESRKPGTVVVCLLPARTDTKWFHEFCTKGKITFVRGRLKFSGSKKSAPFPSMVVVFGEES